MSYSFLAGGSLVRITFSVRVEVRNLEGGGGGGPIVIDESQDPVSKSIDHQAEGSAPCPDPHPTLDSSSQAPGQ